MPLGSRGLPALLPTQGQTELPGVDEALQEEDPAQSKARELGSSQAGTRRHSAV